MRLVSSTVCALVVFLLTYAAAWTFVRNEMAIDDGVSFNDNKFEILREWLATYYQTHFKYPDSFEDVVSSEDYFEARKHERITLDRFPEFFDRWGRRIGYKRINGTYELRSFGRDGVPGGVGPDADVWADPSQLSIPKISPAEFLIHSPGSRPLFRVAVLSSACAAAIAFAGSRRRSGAPL